MRRTTLVCAALLSLLAPAVPAQAQDLCTWTSSELPLPTGVTSGQALFAAPNGNLAGQASSGALLLWHNGASVAVNAPVTTQISLRGLNGSGELVGWDGRTRTAFVYRDGIFQTLPTPSPAENGTSADGINEAGDVVGTAYSSSWPPYRTVVWPRSQPGTYRFVAEDVALGIDDAGRAVTEKGYVVNPDGTRGDLESSPNLNIRKFQAGQALGKQFGDYHAVYRWDVATGAVLQRYDVTSPTPIGVNSAGQLATWTEKASGNAVKVWRGTDYLGELGVGERVRAVQENNDLAGQRKSAAGTWVPVTWTCA
ncbi:hypothetical protein UK23_10940 [Lentzea aerocolonigenes]|uniref:Uncharacterized protein n=1 Tax=Lentzea aerocolonigenes TaxID=68170 RepID=A0A0F0H3S4_LENAE|nr:hypothetical protein [Lentzea aerocolonigenes]KJK50394.1 hypothetical protein UK23_10940 [Lentzea aerocolonigenes]